MEGADDTCGVTAAGIVVNYASLFVTCIASYKIALFVAPLSIGPISIPRGTGFMLVGMLAAGLRPRMIKCAGAVDMASAGTQINNMRLPNDVQVLEVRRANAAVVARGFTKLMIDDELTLCGRPQSLSEVTAIKKGRVVLMLGATDSSFLKSGRLTGRLGSVSARPAQGVPRSSYKYPDQTSVVFRVNVFDAEALHESEQKARDRMSRATHRMSRDSGAGMRDSRATGAD